MKVLFVDWTLHDGIMASTTTILRESFQQDVVNCNVKNSNSAARNYHYDFRNCLTRPRTIQTTWQNYGDSRSKDDAAAGFWEWGLQQQQLQEDEGALDGDVHLTAFVPSMFEVLMAMNKTIVLNFMHRPDLYRCSTQAGKDNIENIRLLASSGAKGSLQSGPLHVVAPGYIHEIEYVRHYAGIQPFYLPVALLDAVPKQDYTGVKPEYILNAGRWFPLPEEVLSSGHTFWRPSRYELADLLQYRAVVLFPYSVSNLKSVEQYDMNIPFFVPTPHFAQELGLFYDRTSTYTPYCPRMNDAQHAPAHNSTPYEFSPNARKSFGDAAEDEIFWIKFAEIYRWPCVRYFDSWQDLLKQLDSTTTEELQKTSQCMKQANKWRKFEVDSATCFMLEQLARPENHIRGRTMRVDLDYRETLQELYGTDALFTA